MNQIARRLTAILAAAVTLNANCIAVCPDLEDGFMSAGDVFFEEADFPAGDSGFAAEDTFFDDTGFFSEDEAWEAGEVFGEDAFFEDDVSAEVEFPDEAAFFEEPVQEEFSDDGAGFFTGDDSLFEEDESLSFAEFAVEDIAFAGQDALQDDSDDSWLFEAEPEETENHAAEAFFEEAEPEAGEFFVEAEYDAGTEEALSLTALPEEIAEVFEPENPESGTENLTGEIGETEEIPEFESWTESLSGEIEEIEEIPEFENQTESETESLSGEIEEISEFESWTESLSEEIEEIPGTDSMAESMAAEAEEIAEIPEADSAVESIAAEAEEIAEIFDAESATESMVTEVEEIAEIPYTDSMVESMAAEVEEIAEIPDAESAVESMVAEAEEIAEIPGADSMAESMESAAESMVTEVEEIAEVPARNERAVFETETDGVTVRAVLEHPEALPAGVELVVTPVTRYTEGYNYDAYLEALNENADMIGYSIGDDGLVAAAERQTEETSDSRKIYTSENTLFYDVAFMAERGEDGDGQTGDGRVEAEPEEGSVRLTFTFRNRQLTRNLDAENADAMTLVHLPLTEDVREAVDSTADATDISPSDIIVEPVTDGSVVCGTEAADAVEFSLDSLSLVAVSGITHGYGGTGDAWEGTDPKDWGDVSEGLGIAGSFSVFADRFINNNHMEGTIAVRELLGSEREFGNTYNVEVTTDRYNVAVEKRVTGESRSGTFRFGLYRRNGDGWTEVGDELVVETGEDGIGTGSFRGSFRADTELWVFEKDASGNPLTGGASYSENGITYTVSYGDNQKVEKTVTNLGNTSYVETLRGTGSNLFNKDRDAVLVVGSGNIVDQTGGMNGYPRITNPWTGADYDVGSGGTVIRAEGEFPISFDAEFRNLRNLSRELANAASGGDLSVINIKAGWYTDFRDDIAGVLGISPNNVENPDLGGIGYLNGDEHLLINIDLTDFRGAEYEVSRFAINGQKSGEWNPVSDRIIFNFVKRGPDGFEPYDGTLRLVETSGTVLLPSGTVSNTEGSFCGTLIASFAAHGSSEIHSRPVNGACATAVVSCLNTAEKQKLCALRIWKTINADGEGTEQDPDGFLREKLYNLRFVIEGPDGYQNEVCYRDFTDQAYGGREYELTDLKPGTYRVTEMDGDIPGYTRETVVRTLDNFTGAGDFYRLLSAAETVGDGSGGVDIGDDAEAMFWFDNRYEKEYPYITMPVTGSHGSLILMFSGALTMLLGAGFLLFGGRRGRRRDRRGRFRRRAGTW